MTFDKFLKTYKVGHSYGYNGTYVGECVSLVKCYIRDVLGGTPQAIGDAKDYWYNRDSKYIKSVFYPIANYTEFVPKRGDVFVRTSGHWGHIGIVISATKDEFYTIEQNAGGCRVVQKLTHTDWSNINFLRPLNQKNFVPKYKVGKMYTLTARRNIRTQAGADKPKVLFDNLTPAGKKVSINGKYGKFRKGTRIRCKAIKHISNDVWVKCPSGWLAAYYNGKQYIK